MQVVPASMVDVDVATAASVTTLSSTLNASITSEATARASADTTLGNRCTALEGVAPVLGTPSATTSGTTKDLTGIPSWVTRIFVTLDNVSLSGTSTLLIQLGTAGGVVSTGYSGGVSQAGASPSQGSVTAGLGLSISSVAASTHTGVVTLIKADSSNKWLMVSTVTRSDGYGQQGGAVVTLGGALTTVRLTAANGTDTLDNGTVNILYM